MMKTLIIVIIYLNFELPADIHKLDFWMTDAECHKIGNLIIQDLKQSSFIKHSDYYCVNNQYE